MCDCGYVQECVGWILEACAAFGNDAMGTSKLQKRITAMRVHPTVWTKLEIIAAHDKAPAGCGPLP